MPRLLHGAGRHGRARRALAARRTAGADMSSTVPVSIALVAGGLAVVNPCGFPLLPSFLSFYLGADKQQLPRAGTRVLQRLLVGALVTVGFVGLFALVSLPVSFGVALVAQAVPWAGLVGALLAHGSSASETAGASPANGSPIIASTASAHRAASSGTPTSPSRKARAGRASRSACSRRAATS